VEGLLSPWHIALLVVILLLVFGPKRLPELGSSIGKTITGFKQGIAEAQEEIRNPADQVTTPAAAPVQAAPLAPAPAVETVPQPASAPTLSVVDAEEPR
jgi:sec-independent protein translocase protein TatA